MMNRSISSAMTGCALMSLFAVLSPVLAVDFQDHPIAIEKELLITDPLVVDSKMATYPGCWSFGYLLEQSCGHEMASFQVGEWLESWAAGTIRENDKVISIGERAGLRDAIIKPWQKRDGYRENAGVPWSPNFAHAPFRLLAIVNRMDLSLPTPEPVWDGWAMWNDELRRNISMHSCCGCHCGDTNTKFYHITPRAAGERAEVSKFLRTDGSSWSLKDPASRKSIRSHEMEDRVKFFASLLDPNMSVADKRKIRESRQLLAH